MPIIHTFDSRTREYKQTINWTPPNAWVALPSDATTIQPPAPRDGFARVLNHAGDAWEHVEDHRGKSGYVAGHFIAVNDLGPLPLGWSDAPPVPTQTELAASVRAERDRRLADCQWIVDRHADQLAAGSATSLTDAQYKAWLTYRQALRDLPAQAGFPWAGGGTADTACPWPVAPSL